jgi:hypothetical protein
MATYAQLSETDKGITDNTITLLRGAARDMAKAFDTIAAIASDTNAIAIVSSLDAAELILDKSDYAGADDMTRQEVTDLYTLLNGMRTTNDTAANRAKLMKACGINAVL